MILQILNKIQQLIEMLIRINNYKRLLWIQKRIIKRKNIQLTNHLTVIIICIISIFAGFFIGRINSSSAKISSLAKSNIENEATLKAKQTELSKLKEKLQKKVDSI